VPLPPEPSTHQPHLLRTLGLREGIAIQIGMIVGSGIFLVPATVAGHLQALGPILLVWILGGLLVLFGSLSLAELSAVLPRTGGPYVYCREGFGPFWGFLYTWNYFFINTAGSVAALAVAFATYLGHLFPVISAHRGFGWIQIAAIASIGLATAINVRGVRLGASVMNFFTTAKVAALVGLMVAVLVSRKGSAANFLPLWPDRWTHGLTVGLGLSMISVLWAYDGWTTVTLTAGEMKSPQRNVPLSLVLGTVVVIALYVSVNLAYSYVLPMPALAASPRVAGDVASLVLGPFGATFVIAGILCSTFGTMHGCLLGGPRCLYAAAEDGVFSRTFAAVHPRFHTPAAAIVTLGVWSALLTLSGTYEQITSYVVFGSWGFYALTASAVIVLRRKLPDAPRPYRAWGYPYATLLFVAVAGWFLYNTLVHDSRNAAIGIGLLVVSLPFYYYWTRK
jgi:basic amino acid/polyamine antiporter, APA family